MIDKNAATTLYPPVEIKDFVADICNKAELSAELREEKEWAASTCIKIEDNTALNIKRIILSESGKDVEKIIKDAVTDSIRRKYEMVELFISLRTPSCEKGYIAAKKYHFKLSGLMPGSENDDYIVMQLLMKSIRGYDQLITVGDFEKLALNVKTLAEKE